MMIVSGFFFVMFGGSRLKYMSRGDISEEDGEGVLFLFSFVF